jgi:hypothetical protein
VFRLHGPSERADEAPARARRLSEYWGQYSPLGVVGPYAEYKKYYEHYFYLITYWILFRFPVWPEPAAILSVRALCVVVRD